MQPGDTITPGSDGNNDSQAADSPATPITPSVQTQPDSIAVDPIQPAPETNWQYANEAINTRPDDGFSPVTWTASEYIAHGKNSTWFLAYGMAVVVLAIIIYILLRDIVTVVVVAIAAATFAAFSVRQPRTLEYTVDDRGIQIGDKFYPYEAFRSFDVTLEGTLPAIHLVSLKRFMPPLTIFYDMSMEDAIVSTISNYLPHQERKADVVDNIARRIRF